MATEHGKPPEGLECMATLEDITEENFVEYRSMPSGLWLPAKFSKEVVEMLLQTQFGKYMSDVEKASKDCAAAVRRLVVKGPPIYLSDVNALPLAKEEDGFIDLFWFAAEQKEVSAKLEGALEGEEREELWSAQKETLAAMEAAESVE